MQLSLQLKQKQDEIAVLQKKVSNLQKDRSDMHSQVCGLIDRIGEWEKLIEQESEQQSGRSGEPVQNQNKDASLFNMTPEQPL